MCCYLNIQFQNQMVKEVYSTVEVTRRQNKIVYLNDEFENGQSYYRNIILKTKEIHWKSEPWYSVSIPPVSTVTGLHYLGV